MDPGHVSDWLRRIETSKSGSEVFPTSRFFITSPSTEVQVHKYDRQVTEATTSHHGVELDFRYVHYLLSSRIAILSSASFGRRGTYYSCDAHTFAHQQHKLAGSETIRQHHQLLSPGHHARLNRVTNYYLQQLQAPERLAVHTSPYSLIP